MYIFWKVKLRLYWSIQWNYRVLSE